MYNNMGFGMGIPEQNFCYRENVEANHIPNQVNPLAVDMSGLHRKTTKRECIQYITQMLGASDVVAVNEFETLNTRHICQGSTQIKILLRQVIGIPTTGGVLSLGYYLCPECRKLIYNKSCLDEI